MHLRPGYLLVHPQSITAFKCFPSNDLLSDFMGVTDDLYGDIKPNVPTKQHLLVPTLKENVKTYIQTHTSLQCHSFTGEEGRLLQDKAIPSAYSVTLNIVFNEIDHTDVDFKVAVVRNERKRYLNGST